MMRALALTLIAALALSACEKKGLQIEAPTQRGVCWHLADKTGGGINVNKVDENIKSLELCAAKLEIMRLSFMRMGLTTENLVGAYQGNFIFLNYKGIYTAKKFDGARYLVLVRYNGKLVVPGAVPR